MVSLKYFLYAVVVAVALAAEEERVKKDVLLGTLPYAYSAYPQVAYSYDDGKYYPGKYVAASALHVPTYAALSPYSALPAVPAVSAVHAVPSYVHSPYTYGSYVKPVIY